MIQIRQFVQSGGGLSEDELGAMIRERMLMVPVGSQREWLQQVELSLDGYGGERQLAAAGQVRAELKRLGEGLAK